VQHAAFEPPPPPPPDRPELPEGAAPRWPAWYAGVEPGEALHVGDKVDNDIEGAAAAGVRGVLLQREGEPPPGVEAIRSLEELPALL